MTTATENKFLQDSFKMNPILLTKHQFLQLLRDLELVLASGPTTETGPEVACKGLITQLRYALSDCSTELECDQSCQPDINNNCSCCYTHHSLAIMDSEMSSLSSSPPPLSCMPTKKTKDAFVLRSKDACAPPSKQGENGPSPRANEITQCELAEANTNLQSTPLFTLEGFRTVHRCLVCERDFNAKDIAVRHFIFVHLRNHSGHNHNLAQKTPNSQKVVKSPPKGPARATVKAKAQTKAQSQSQMKKTKSPKTTRTSVKNDLSTNKKGKSRGGGRIGRPRKAPVQVKRVIKPEDIIVRNPCKNFNLKKTMSARVVLDRRLVSQYQKEKMLPDPDQNLAMYNGY